MNARSENEAFARLIAAIEPWLGEIVIIGGWAHRLYRLHPSAQTLDYTPLSTFDADIAIPNRVSKRDQDIRQRLLANHFSEEPLGNDKPPATHYQLSEPGRGFFAEFLTPLKGSDYSRHGQRKATKRIGGVVTQQLRHLEILLHAPWSVDLDESKGFPLPSRCTVKVANPAAFLAHKLLAHRARRRANFAKDILYIHDTLETFGARLPELRREWKQHIRPRLHERNALRVETGVNALFGELSDSVREAARIAIDRRLSPEAIREVCHFGLTQVLAGAKR